jgi:hypothetical protein
VDRLVLRVGRERLEGVHGDIASLDPARLRPRLLIADAVGPGIAPTSPDTSAIAGGRPDKTGIVYCKDNNRPGRFDRTAFTFLGYTFRPRPARDRHGATFLAFLPAISPQALKKISTQVRRWRLHRWIFHTFGEVARTINPVVAGWMQYYRRFYPSALYRLLAPVIHEAVS